MKVLVMRLSSIGDVLLTTPVVRCLKQQVPDAEVHFLTRGANGELLKGNPNIDKLLLLQESMDETVAMLKRENYDFVVDLHNNHRTRKIRLSLGVQHSVYRKENLRKFVYVWTKLDVMSGRHVVDRYMQAVERLGVADDGKGLEVCLPAELVGARLLEQRVGELKLADVLDVPYVAIACGGQHATKRLPLERVAELCAHLKECVVLLGDAGDRSRIEQSGISLSPNVVNLCGRTTLMQTAAIVAASKVVVTSDSSLLHIASVFSRPVVAVWGATTPSFGFSAFRTKSVDCEAGRLWCRPCSRMGSERCFRGSYACMQKQDWQGIAGTVNDLLMNAE